MAKNQKRTASRKRQPKHKNHLMRHTTRCAPYHSAGWSPNANPSYQPVVPGRDDKVM